MFFKHLRKYHICITIFKDYIELICEFVSCSYLEMLHLELDTLYIKIINDKKLLTLKHVRVYFIFINFTFFGSFIYYCNLSIRHVFNGFKPLSLV